MPARKRTHVEVDQEVVAPAQLSLLDRVRNCWEFASLMQYIFFFGQAVKIDKDLDIEMLEIECIKPGNSQILSEIGLALLKYVSSHKGLTIDIFDEYTRRQFVAKAPERNPFGIEEEPGHFIDFDIFTKLRVLHQLSVWTLNNPERIREKMEEKEGEQTQWRIEPLGWDAEERSYFMLDDDRLYRRTEPPPPPPPPKAKSKPKKTKGRRTSKRQKLAEPAEDSAEDEEHQSTLEVETKAEDVDDGLGGAKWECIAVSLVEYNTFLDTIRKSRDPDEKVLFKRITEDVLPVIEKRAESQERKAAQRRREMENLEKLATAKRSSRLAGKQEKQREVQLAEDAERKRREDLAMARREQDKQIMMEEARESRMITREQRLKDREVKRILHEEELARLRSDSEEGSQAGARISERSRKLELEKTQKELEKLNEDEEEWYFDCAVCGVHGKNLDDGSHSIACEVCNVWQHIACHGIKEGEAESDDFHFICASCKKPKVTSLKLRLGPSASPQEEKEKMQHVYGVPPHSNGDASSATPDLVAMMPPLANSRTLNNAPAASDNENQADRYLAKSQGRFSPTTIPNGYSALLPQSTAGASSQNEMSHPNGVHDPSLLPSLDPHNPYLNHFGRQRVLPAQQQESTLNDISSLQASTPAPGPANLIQTPYNTMLYPTPRPTNLANSPTPSLSATQGNTNVRFSASPKAAGSPRSSSYIPVPTENTANHTIPPAALSPLKSSPSHIWATPAHSQNGHAFEPALASSAIMPPSSERAVLSPIKHEIATLSSLDGAADMHDSVLHVRQVSPLAAAPLLSPSFEAGRRDLEPPVKKQTPVKVGLQMEDWRGLGDTPMGSAEPKGEEQ